MTATSNRYMENHTIYSELSNKKMQTSSNVIKNTKLNLTVTALTTFTMLHKFMNVTVSIYHRMERN